MLAFAQVEPFEIDIVSKLSYWTKLDQEPFWFMFKGANKLSNFKVFTLYIWRVWLQWDSVCLDYYKQYHTYWSNLIGVSNYSL